jgi:hypothetical protein
MESFPASASRAVSGLKSSRNFILEVEREKDKANLRFPVLIQLLLQALSMC